MTAARYTILETPIGPVISESRMTVYDVMLAYDEGLTRYEIATTYNLTPMQVETALEYIAERRETLEQELAEIRARQAEREAYYRAQAAERERQIAELPMTPERAAFYARREQNRLKRQQQGTENSLPDAAKAEKVAALDPKAYLDERASRGSLEHLRELLSRAPDVEPDDADRLP